MNLCHIIPTRRLSQGYIRLISINLGNPDDPIELDLNSVRFRPGNHTNWISAEYIPRYEALSYIWDEDERKDKIVVILNGKPFYITSNLHSALLAIRRNNVTSQLWIDAICIDQNDNAEKEKQLRIMHQIYKNATNVRVWLGSDDQSVDIRAGLSLMSHCLEKFEYSKLGSDWNILYSTRWNTVLWRVIFGESIKNIIGKEGAISFETIGANYRNEKETIVQRIDWHTGPEYSSGWKAIKKIVARPYFTRSWIIQKMVLSSNRSLFIGDHEMTDILRVVELLYATPEIQRELPPECRIEREDTSRIHHLFRSIAEYDEALNLGKLLATFRGKGSKMPEDQIYSLLGLTGRGELAITGIAVQSIRKLCTDTAEHILAQDKNLDVLRMVNTHAKPRNEKEWPSWVPDFTSPLPGLGEPKGSLWKLPLADLSRTMLPEEKKDFCIENDKLLIYGHVLSEVRKPVGIVENNGRRDKALEHGKRPIGERQLPLFELEFPPMGIWEDSEGREVHGTVDFKKGDLVVMVARSESPLILRRLKGKKGKECEWPEYNVGGTAHTSELDLIKFKDLAKKIKWDFQKMAIV
ncbi:hypothetical protein EAF00_005519 [Botryotinia globosa]|nr:hypothetical protein EAF00_005519 [Botryotinia globosa]